MDTSASKGSCFANKTILKLRWFFNSKLYPLILVFFALISHTFSIEELGITIILATALPALLICDDMKFFISPLIVFIFMFSEKSVSSGKFYKTPYLIAILCGAVVLSLFLIAHFIIYRKSIRIKGFTNSRLIWGIVFLSASILLNGALNFENYQFENLIYASAFILALFLVFFVFSINTKESSGLIDYVIFVLFLISIMLTLQLYLSFIGQIQIVNGQIVKESIKVGWGMWNNIGGMLAFLLPVHFYYVSKIKKLGPLFYLTAIISFVAIALTLSRSSLLTSAVIVLICAIVCCFKGNNKIANRIITGILAILCVVGIIALWGKISSILGDYLSRGLDDNGRFEMYLHGLFNFIENPIFGGGFYSSYATEHMFIAFLPYRYHNTIIQMMATCGSFGILAYMYHRYQTVMLFWEKKKRLSTIFTALCIVALLLSSLLDNHFFNLYPTFMYAVILVAVEKTTD